MVPSGASVDHMDHDESAVEAKSAATCLFKLADDASDATLCGSGRAFLRVWGTSANTSWYEVEFKWYS